MFGKTYDLGRRSRKRHSGEVEVQKGGHERGGEATKMCWEISSQEDWSESSKKMKAVKMSMLGAFPLLLYICLLSVGLCQKELQNQIQEWNYREGADKVNIQGIKSITRVLEKWANSIFWQTKHSLLSHPNVLLPELSSKNFGACPCHLTLQLHSCFRLVSHFDLFMYNQYAALETINASFL
uniref:Uncharacterized protein isoform X2 n=1 Tax=Pogona vitticeps TaxID=103695 RepID=A0ABM5GF70_9SAUR